MHKMYNFFFNVDFIIKKKKKDRAGSARARLGPLRLEPKARAEPHFFWPGPARLGSGQKKLGPKKLGLGPSFFFPARARLVATSNCILPIFTLFSFTFSMSRYQGERRRSADRPDTEFEHFFNPAFDSTSVKTDTTSHNTMSDNEHDGLYRTLHDYLQSMRTSTPSCIMFPPNMPRVDFKSGMIQLLPNFHGLENENMYVHVREFEEVVATFHNQHGTMDAIMLNSSHFLLRKWLKAGCIH